MADGVCFRAYVRSLARGYTRTAPTFDTATEAAAYAERLFAMNPTAYDVGHVAIAAESGLPSMRWVHELGQLAAIVENWQAA